MTCENIKQYYYDYLENPEAVPSDIGEHLEQCSDCRKEIDSLRELLGQAVPPDKPCRPKYLQLHYQLVDQWVSCETVRPFLPSLLVPEFGTRLQTPVTAHVENCPACQKRLKEIASLQLVTSDLMKAAGYLASQQSECEFDKAVCEVLYRIKHGDRSDVITRMRFRQTDDIEKRLLSDSAIIDVEHRGTRPAEVVPRRIPSRWGAPIWVTSGIAAAVLFAVMLVLPTGDVKALDARQLYANLETVRNAHIQKFGGKKELENIWIAGGLGVLLFQQEQNAVLVDTHSRQIYQKIDGTVQLVSQQTRMELERPWGLLPFKNISELPGSYNWEYISDAELESGLKVKIYEWSWTESLDNHTQMRRMWRGYLDTHSNLPYRIEWWDTIGDSPAQLMMEMKITYPSDAECLEVFDGLGFPEAGYGAHDELDTTFPAASNVGTMEGVFLLSTWPSAKAVLNFPDE